MSTQSSRSINITFQGDVNGNEVYAAASNLNSPAASDPVNIGVNTVITVPGGGTTPSSVTIIKPAGNLIPITLKGVAGDAGIALNLTDPDSISLASGQSSFVLSSPSTVPIRLLWS